MRHDESNDWRGRRPGPDLIGKPRISRALRDRCGRPCIKARTRATMGSRGEIGVNL